ncbi:MAG TPA: hypothetical protein PLJ62_00320 [Thermoflexales bacterium]|nr:hypothetical protein [Thermoflexales bacterium]HQW35600.1 hypothetical protein [Thermoflexales bacterium]HQZ22197.1 hypothetical protein [Thermoflexales bacterium]HQZ98618.1 hypothetical protein [Thermoflexales bacterium]
MQNENQTVEACINIGPAERKKRMRMGVMGFVLGAALAIALMALRLPNEVRLITFVPFMLGGVGLFQALDKTCVYYAMRDSINMDDGEHKIEDDGLKTALRQKANTVLVKAGALAFTLAMFAYVLP